MDAITIQVLRNKIASLVDEMHYHFYRSGYSTIIRESRDFSCVVLDKDGVVVASSTAPSGRGNDDVVAQAAQLAQIAHPVVTDGLIEQA